MFLTLPLSGHNVMPDQCSSYLGHRFRLTAGTVLLASLYTDRIAPHL